MNIYLISQTVNDDYDTFDSAVVAADSEDNAKMTHPNKEKLDWNGKNGIFGSWCELEDVEVNLIGKAKEGTEAGVICASFNAG